MFDHMQESIDIRTINWKEDEASREGTQALRYLVQSLHDAQANPSLQPMVQALMISNNLLPSTSHVDATNHLVEPSHKGGKIPKIQIRRNTCLRLHLEGDKFHVLLIMHLNIAAIQPQVQTLS